MSRLIPGSFLLLVLLGPACSDDGRASPDSSPDSPNLPLDLTQSDRANRDRRDAAPDSAVDCCASDLPPAADLPPGRDSAFWDAGGRPYGQCVADSDCYWGLPCALEPPGGLCAECTLPDDCGDTFTYDCVEGLCQRLCLLQAHCPLGHGCTENHWCEPLACGPGQPTCPVPYVCGDNLTCRRPACAANEPRCPSGMICGAADLCMENYE